MKNLTDPQRNFIFQCLLMNSTSGKLKYGSITKIANQFGISTRSVKRIWDRGMISFAVEQQQPGNVSSRRKGRGGRKSKHSIEYIQQKVSELSLNNRTTIRRMEQYSGISRYILHKAKKNGHLIRHSNAVRPKLSSANKTERIKFSMSFIHTHNKPFEFDAMHDMIHIDEKWFDMMKVKESYYLVPSEIEPYRAVQSKRFIGRVMFLCAIARPRYDYRKRKMFDGKIGIWPFVERVAAKRSSKNRPAGTIEVKPIVVTREVYREYLTNKVLPAIRDKFPFKRNTKVRIQQDNAKPHVAEDDEYILNHFQVDIRK